MGIFGTGDPAWTVDCADVESHEALTAQLHSIASRSGQSDVAVFFKNLAALSPSGSCMLCVVNRTLVLGRKRIALPRREFEVALILATHAGPVSRSLLGTLIRPGSQPEQALTFAKVYISRLRKRLGADGSMIARNFAGYYLAQPVALDLDLIEGRLVAADGLAPAPGHLLELRSRIQAIVGSEADTPPYATIRSRLLRIERRLMLLCAAEAPMHEPEDRL